MQVYDVAMLDCGRDSAQLVSHLQDNKDDVIDDGTDIKVEALEPDLFEKRAQMRGRES